MPYSMGPTYSRVASTLPRCPQRKKSHTPSPEISGWNHSKSSEITREISRNYINQKSYYIVDTPLGPPTLNWLCLSSARAAPYIIVKERSTFFLAAWSDLAWFCRLFKAYADPTRQERSVPYSFKLCRAFVVTSGSFHGCAYLSWKELRWWYLLCGLQWSSELSGRINSRIFDMRTKTFFGCQVDTLQWHTSHASHRY